MTATLSAPARKDWEPATRESFSALFRAQAGGVAVITADAGHGPVAMTATSVSSVSVEPLLLVFSTSDASSSSASLRAADTLVVHFIDSSELEIARLGATSGIDRFADQSMWSRLESGEPYFTAVRRLARVRTVSRLRTGTAELLIAEVLEVPRVEADAAAAPPLVYFGRAWHALGEHSRLVN